MIEASKDAEINNIRFRASGNIFQNSECVFVEYNDCIQMPWFTFLTFFVKNDAMQEFFDIEYMKHLSIPALMEYYLNREHINPLIDLIKDESTVDVSKLDEFLYDQIESNEVFFSKNTGTQIVPIVNNLLKTGLVKKVVIYYPHDCEFVRSDIEDKFLGQAEFRFGEIEEVIKTLPQDTTYIFSDANNVLVLEELKKLDFSAFLIPNNFKYNFVDDKREEFVVNMKYLEEKYTFKWARYNIS